MERYSRSSGFAGRRKIRSRNVSALQDIRYFFLVKYHSRVSCKMRATSRKIVSIKRIGNLIIKPLEFPMLHVVLKRNAFREKSAFPRDQKMQKANRFIKNPFAFKFVVRSSRRRILEFYSSQCGERNPNETEWARSSWKRVSSYITRGVITLAIG